MTPSEEPTDGVYHRGELAIQRLFGVEARGARMAMNIVPDLSDKHIAVLERTELLVLALIHGGYPVSFFLTGEAGSLRADPTRTAVDVWPEHTLPCELTSRAGAPVEVGTLAIDFATRGRVRINGTATVDGDRHLTLAADHIFPNCVSHVVRRISFVADPVSGPVGDGAASSPTRPTCAAELSAGDIEFAHRTETLFLATSANADGDVDVAHRGGPAGFVTATPRRLEFIEYRGNDMFQSLGNLALHTACSVSLVSLRDQRHLWVMGQGRLHKEGDSQSVVVDVERVEQRRWPSPRSWRDAEDSG